MTGKKYEPDYLSWHDMFTNVSQFQKRRNMKIIVPKKEKRNMKITVPNLT